MIDDIIQAYILGASAVSVWMYTRPGRRRLRGYVLCLSTEPMWFYLAWKSGQWGVMILAMWWAWRMIVGIKTELKGNANAST